MESNIEIEVGKSQKLEFEIIPENATEKTVVFESSAPDIVTVEPNGIVTAHSFGEATITVTCDEIVKTVNVIVKEKTADVNSTDIQTLPHVHSYGSIKYESEHPHKGYKLCLSCGNKEYTNGTWQDNSCTTCNPPHVHSYSSVKYEAEHPHKGYKLCLSCGNKEYTNSTWQDNSCTTCNPPHVHSYGSIKYESEHPHEGYKVCYCGARISANYNQIKSDCNECYPCTYCNSTAHLTKNHPACSDCGSKNHATYEHDESDGWVTKLPSYVNETKYDIDYKTEYLYKTRETTTSSKASKSGWNLYDEDWEWGEYGSWSGWQDNYVAESDSRDVETRDVVDVPEHTEYRYGAYVGDNNRGNRPCSYCATGETNRTPKEVWTSWSETKVTTPSGWNYKCPYGCTHKGGQYFSTANSPGGRGAGYYWHDYKVSGYGDVFFWEETRQVNATYRIQYKYRERDKVYTYYFEKWTEDSNWSTTEKSVNDNRKLVETRTVYKWVLK